MGKCSSPFSTINGVKKRVAKVFGLVYFEMKEAFHLCHLREVELYCMVANSNDLIIELDHLSANNRLVSFIWAYEA